MNHFHAFYRKPKKGICRSKQDSDQVLQQNLGAENSTASESPFSGKTSTNFPLMLIFFQKYAEQENMELIR